MDCSSCVAMGCGCWLGSGTVPSKRRVGIICPAGQNLRSNTFIWGIRHVTVCAMGLCVTRIYLGFDYTSGSRRSNRFNYLTPEGFARAANNAISIQPPHQHMQPLYQQKE